MPDSVAHLVMLQFYTGSQVQIIWSCINTAVVYMEAYWVYEDMRIYMR